MSKHLVLLAFILTFLISCQEDEEGNKPEINVNLSGYVQKGPFLNGSTVTIIELDEKFQPSGRTFTTEIQDNRGTFVFDAISLLSPYVELTGEGFYYNEVKGEESSAPLTLKAIVNIKDKTATNLNVLLHLQRERVAYLIGEGKSLEDAKTQAQQEVVRVFGIEKSTIASAETMDISKEGDEHAILLAISATLQGQNTVAELSELLANISSDIREDGKLDNETIKEKIRAGAISISPANIKENLIKRYKEVGTEVALPDFEKYLDSDGDGIINSEDDETPDEFSFTPITEAKMDTFYISETIILQGLPNPTESWLWAGGGDYSATLIVNGEELIDNNTSLSDGDEIAIKLHTGSDFSTTYLAELVIGTFTSNWTITTGSNPFQAIGYPGYSDYSLKTFLSNQYVFAGLGADIGFAYKKEWYAYDAENNTWTEKASFPGDAALNIAVSVNDKFYAGLGENGKAIWQYDPEVDSWTAIADFPGEANTYFAYSSGGKLYAGLGDNGNALWAYDLATNAWSPIADFPAGTSDVKVFYINTEAFAWVSFQEGDRVPEIWQFNSANQLWQTVANAQASNFLFAIDGQGYFAEENSSDLLSFSPATASWTTIATLPKTNPKFGFTLQGKGYLYFNTDFKNSFYTLDPSNNSITQIKGSEQESRSFLFAITTEKYAILNTSVSTAMGSSFYRFTP